MPMTTNLYTHPADFRQLRPTSLAPLVPEHRVLDESYRAALAEFHWAQSLLRDSQARLQIYLRTEGSAWLSPLLPVTSPLSSFSSGPSLSPPTEIHC